MDKVILIPLGVFLLLFGIMQVTNLQIVWMGAIMGLAALCAGAVCLFRAFR